MPRQSTSRAESSFWRTIARPFSSAYAYLMRLTGRTQDHTQYSAARGGAGNAGDSSRRAEPRRKQRQGRRHGRRR